MSDHDHDLRTRVGELEEALLRQEAIRAATMDLLVQQIGALCLVNAALAGALSGRGLLDLEQVRTVVLAKLSEEQRSGIVGETINATLTVAPAEPPAAAEPTADELRERARARFTVFEGGGQGSGEPES